MDFTIYNPVRKIYILSVQKDSGDVQGKMVQPTRAEYSKPEGCDVT